MRRTVRGQPLLEDHVSLVDSLSPWSAHDDDGVLFPRRTIRLCDWSRNVLAGQGFAVIHAPLRDGMSNALREPFPREGLFHRKVDVFLLSSPTRQEQILVRLGRNPEELEATVYYNARPRGPWLSVNGREGIFALRVDAVNIAWMTFDLPSASNSTTAKTSRRTLRLSLHNICHDLSR